MHEAVFAAGIARDQAIHVGPSMHWFAKFLLSVRLVLPVPDLFSVGYVGAVVCWCGSGAVGATGVVECG